MTELISLEDVLTVWVKSKGYESGARLVIISDCCYSGAWAARSRQQGGIKVRIDNVKVPVHRFAIQTAADRDETTDDYVSFTTAWIKSGMNRFNYEYFDFEKDEMIENSPQCFASWDPNNVTVKLPFGPGMEEKIITLFTGLKR